MFWLVVDVGRVELPQSYDKGISTELSLSVLNLSHPDYTFSDLSHPDLSHPDL